MNGAASPPSADRQSGGAVPVATPQLINSTAAATSPQPDEQKHDASDPGTEVAAILTRPPKRPRLNSFPGPSATAPTPSLLSPTWSHGSVHHGQSLAPGAGGWYHPQQPAFFPQLSGAGFGHPNMAAPPHATNHGAFHVVPAYPTTHHHPASMARASSPPDPSAAATSKAGGDPAPASTSSHDILGSSAKSVDATKLIAIQVQLTELRSIFETDLLALKEIIALQTTHIARSHEALLAFQRSHDGSVDALRIEHQEIRSDIVKLQELNKRNFEYVFKELHKETNRTANKIQASLAEMVGPLVAGKSRGSHTGKATSSASLEPRPQSSSKALGSRPETAASPPPNVPPHKTNSRAHSMDVSEAIPTAGGERPSVLSAPPAPGASSSWSSSAAITQSATIAVSNEMPHYLHDDRSTAASPPLSRSPPPQNSMSHPSHQHQHLSSFGPQQYPSNSLTDPNPQPMTTTPFDPRFLQSSSTGFPPSTPISNQGYYQHHRHPFTSNCTPYSSTTHNAPPMTPSSNPAAAGHGSGTISFPNAHSIPDSIRLTQAERELVARSPFFHDWFSKEYYQTLISAVAQHLGQPAVTHLVSVPREQTFVQQSQDNGLVKVVMQNVPGAKGPIEGEGFGLDAACLCAVARYLIVLGMG